MATERILHFIFFLKIAHIRKLIKFLCFTIISMLIIFYLKEKTNISLIILTVNHREPISTNYSVTNFNLTPAFPRTAISNARSTNISRPIASLKSTTKKLRSRCEEIRRRVSKGLVDYVKWDGDPELLQLVQPIFTKKRLVVWSLDEHHGPISDIRSIIEPLGVEFIEHTIFQFDCKKMCTCDDEFKGLTPFDRKLIWYPDNKFFDMVYWDPAAAPDISRADAFLVTTSIPLIELYMRYNRSIFVVAAIRYEYYASISDRVNKWLLLNDQLRSLISKRHNIIGANSLYDVEYLHYFLGSRPEYVPGFTVYTGEHWRPTRHSFLVIRTRHLQLPGGFEDAIASKSRKLNASFKLEHLNSRYPFYEYSDLAAHLGIVHLPYQVSIMAFFEEYTMGIPLFAPSPNLLTRLHLSELFVVDKSHARIVGLNRQRESLLPVHPNYNGSARIQLNVTSPKTNSNENKYLILDPNNDFDERSVRFWLSLADFYNLPHIVLFDSYEQVADILHYMWTDRSRLQTVHDAMRVANRSRLKSLLKYWRRRLRDIAEYSQFKPS